MGWQSFSNTPKHIDDIKTLFSLKSCVDFIKRDLKKYEQKVKSSFCRDKNQDKVSKLLKKKSWQFFSLSLSWL